ncbi:hypothetical protein KDL45_17745, partial [bacterium]|nr:hypothetical protein [bacterium]
MAVLIFIWVALPSGTYTPVDEDLAPESITTLTNNARTRMGTEESWPLIKEERFPTPQDEPTFYRQRGARGVVNVDPKMYPMHAPVARPDRQPEKKRRDPELYPVEKLEVAVAYGPVLEIDRTPAAVGVRPSSDGLVGRELPERIRARLGARGGVGGVGRDNNFKTK